jgi:hypothetical protein
MAGAVLAAMLLTLLLPDELRLGPRWLLPILEGALLVVLIVGDPGRISKRSSVLRGFSVALVTVLIAQSLWSTARLIEELIVGGPHTNKPGPLLAAAGIVWVSNNIAFALLYWELDSGGAAERAHALRDHPDLAFPQQMNPDIAPCQLAASFHRLPLSGVHQRHGVQSDRCHAVGTLGQDGDGRPGGDLVGGPGSRGRAHRQRADVKPG